MVGVYQGWRLVAAPPQMDSHGYSLVFWEPANDDNHIPQASKVVSNLCCVLALNNWHKGWETLDDWNIKQAGVMDIGQQDLYGVPNESVPTVAPAKSLKPRKRTIKRIQDQSQLRMDVKSTPQVWFFRCSE